MRRRKSASVTPAAPPQCRDGDVLEAPRRRQRHHRIDDEPPSHPCRPPFDPPARGFIYARASLAKVSRLNSPCAGVASRPSAAPDSPVTKDRLRPIRRRRFSRGDVRASRQDRPPLLEHAEPRRCVPPRTSRSGQHGGRDLRLARHQFAAPSTVGAPAASRESAGKTDRSPARAIASTSAKA